MRSVAVSVAEVGHPVAPSSFSLSSGGKLAMGSDARVPSSNPMSLDTVGPSGSKRRGVNASRARKRRSTFLNAAEGRQKPGVGPQLSFLEKLVKMLEEESPEIVTWTSQGDSFVICDQQRFANEVLPKYFRSAKWNSFQRQLNLYNFYVHNKTFDRLVYANPLFRRGQVDMIRLIKRSPVKRKVESQNGIPISRTPSPFEHASNGNGLMAASGMGPQSHPNLLGLGSPVQSSPMQSSPIRAQPMAFAASASSYDGSDHLSMSSAETSDSASMDEADYEPSRKSMRYDLTSLRRSSSAPDLRGNDPEFGEEEAVSALLGLLGQKNASL